MVNDEEDEGLEGFFQLFLSKYQIVLEPSIEDIDFIFDYILNIPNFVFHFYLLYYKCHKVNFKHSGSYIDSRDWVKYKKGTINTIDKKDK